MVVICSPPSLAPGGDRGQEAERNPPQSVLLADNGCSADPANGVGGSQSRPSVGSDSLPHEGAVGAVTVQIGGTLAVPGNEVARGVVSSGIQCGESMVGALTVSTVNARDTAVQVDFDKGD